MFASDISTTYVELLNVGSPGLFIWYDLDAHDLDGVSPGTMTSSHVTVYN